ncbi:HsdM family class I SAM-dependent methyltransferase [Thiomicrorhabdus indica]|uniref:HsdM family class I SAM-dependent methyltransferase n=1 Tax=Thiomicrorhabdus indica TaxID=2267253 RepID=UPI00102D8517|nr:N-6 DNA methylase [Thiomicrorhabdus indica]
MNKEIFKFLNSCSCSVIETNRLIVSSFLKTNNYAFVKNKLINSLIIKENDKDFELFQEFEKKFSVVSLESLITSFEFVISPEDKIVTGAIYTPKSIRKFIIDSLIHRESFDKNSSVCDLACGCGGFLVTAAEIIHKDFNFSYEDIFAKHLFGVDLMEYSIERTEIILSILAILNGEDKQEFNFNLFVGNTLGFDFHKVIDGFNGFDFVVGNPPYVCSRNIDNESKLLLKNWNVSSTGHPDLYIPFFEIGLRNLKSSGVLGYITMNTFFKSLNGRALREFLSGSEYPFSIIDFGDLQVFESRSTYTCICFITNKSNGCIRYKRITKINAIDDSGMKKIDYNLLDNHNGWNLQATEIISKIEATGQPFQKVFRTSNGIATLKNNIFIFSPIEEDEVYYHIQDGFKIEKNICVDIVNSNKFIDCNDLTIAKRKIIFPYFYENGSASVIQEKKMASCYPEAYRYLLAHKEPLSRRDKGKGKYQEWFSYGRNQGLDKHSFKLLFPHISPKIPNYILSNDDSLLFHNGMALISQEEYPLRLAKKIMQSRLFWFYITNTSKPYGSGYFSLSKNYIKSFGIYPFSDEDIEYLLSENSQNMVDAYLEKLYGIDLSSVN